MITVTHKQSKDGQKTFATITGISKMMKGMECPEAHNELLKFAIDEWDEETFEKLSQYTKDKIYNSIEGSKKKPITMEDLESVGL